jgi:hypothetical protein
MARGDTSALVRRVLAINAATVKALDEIDAALPAAEVTA